MEAREILARFKKNEITLEEAEHYFRKEPFEKMGGYATLDSHREVRSGFPEVISIFFRSYMRTTEKFLERERPDISMSW